jgi:capsular polysaccharide biosynthesis protein
MPLQTFNFVPLQRWCRPVHDIQTLLAQHDVWLPWRPSKTEPLGLPDYYNDPADIEFLGSDVARREFGYVLRRNSPEQFTLELNESVVASVSDTLILRDNFVSQHYTVLLHEGVAAMEAYDAPDAAERMTETAGEAVWAKIYDQDVKIRFYRHLEEETSQLEDCVLMAHDNSFNYSHFMFQVIPRFQCLEQFPELRDLPLLMPPYPAGGFHSELLAPLIGNCRTMVMPTIAGRCRRLILPTLFVQGGYSREQLDMVGNYVKRALKVPPPTRRRRILISRADAASRRIVNEDELLQTLAPMGFERFTLSDLPVKRQVELFQEADVIVAPHGAGNTNLVFAQEGALFIEFLPRCYPHPAHWIMCKLKGLRHARIVMDHDAKQDMVIDTALVRRLVEQF